MPSRTGPAPDPIAEAAHALLSAIEAEPMPPRLVELAQSLKAALDGKRDRTGGDR